MHPPLSDAMEFFARGAAETAEQGLDDAQAMTALSEYVVCLSRRLKLEDAEAVVAEALGRRLKQARLFNFCSVLFCYKFIE